MKRQISFVLALIICGLIVFPQFSANAANVDVSTCISRDKRRRLGF